MGFIDGLLSGLGLTGDSSGSGLGSGLFGGFMSMFNAGLDSLGLSQHGRDQYFNREMQREFLERQIQAQSQENQLNRDFSKEMLDLNWQKTLQNYPELLKISSDNQFNLWRNQFIMQNEYNSPVNQVSRMMSAGINPAANGAPLSQGVNSMGASTTTPPPNIQGSPLGGSISPMGLPQGLSGKGTDISEIGRFLKDYSEMQLNQKKIGRFDEQMDAQIKESLAKAGLDESKTKYQDLINSVDGFFLPHQKASEVKLNLALAAKYAAEENEAESQKKLNDALEELYKTKNERAKAELPFVEMELRAEIDDIKASAAEKRAQANKAKQETETEKYNTQIKSIQAEVDRKSKMEKLATLINGLRSQRQVDTAIFKEAKVKFLRLKGIVNKLEASQVNYEVDNYLEWLKSKAPVFISVGK